MRVEKRDLSGRGRSCRRIEAQDSYGRGVGARANRVNYNPARLVDYKESPGQVECQAHGADQVHLADDRSGRGGTHEIDLAQYSIRIGCVAGVPLQSRHTETDDAVVAGVSHPQVALRIEGQAGAAQQLPRGSRREGVRTRRRPALVGTGTDKGFLTQNEVRNLVAGWLREGPGIAQDAVIAGIGYVEIAGFIDRNTGWGG